MSGHGVLRRARILWIAVLCCVPCLQVHPAAWQLRLLRSDGPNMELRQQPGTLDLMVDWCCSMEDWEAGSSALTHTLIP